MQLLIHRASALTLLEDEQKFKLGGVLTAIISHFERQLIGNKISFTPCSIHILPNPNKFHNFGGLGCFAGLCSEYARNNTKWSIYMDGEIWISDDTIINIFKCQIWHCHVEEHVEMIELDSWFTQFGVRMQKLCKLQVPDSCCAEATGRPPGHLCQTHLALPQYH